MLVVDYIGYLVAFFVTVGLIFVLRPAALAWGLLDHPGGRKSHIGKVPVIGGLAIFGGVLAASFFMPDSASVLLAFGVAALLVLLGVVDDAHGLSPRNKFAAQIAASILMIIAGGVRIDSLGFLASNQVALSGMYSIAFTVFGVVGVINAVNMIDGMDGLAGGVSAVALAFFAAASFLGGSEFGVQLALLTLSAVLGFLVFNVRFKEKRARVFMGDAGSLLLGFILAWLAVSLSQGGHRAITPIAAVWIVGVPLLDALTVMFQRIWDGKSPFSADRGHMHHILLDHGFSVNQALMLILGLALIFGGIGLASVHFAIPENWMLIAALAIFVVYFTVTLKVKRKRQDSLPLVSADADLEETGQAS